MDEGNATVLKKICWFNDLSSFGADSLYAGADNEDDRVSEEHRNTSALEIFQVPGFKSI